MPARLSRTAPCWRDAKWPAMCPALQDSRNPGGRDMRVFGGGMQPRLSAGVGDPTSNAVRLIADLQRRQQGGGVA